ncbi:3-oxoacyl-[acyl-carrier protein] reductase [Agrobacterium pusense]|uniref:SDR family NAD(P)-dependent oxidoreductase n=1 Tax=Agrobacterium pusense TaxID=648995 RepID=UPI0028594910|nr:SDR family oxidoreductase [Agrobacterium pusense]MDR6192701.1 3-oxoacyl-[acyl-carrier protein] reductase [Agrobacterium pusense]
MKLHFGLTGRNYLVTGANSGIGRAIAIALAGQGANVAVHYLGAPTEVSQAAHTILGEGAATEVADHVRRLGGKVATIAADLSVESEIITLVSKAESEIGKLDGLINNAAACELPDRLVDANFGRYRRHYDVNLAAPALLMADFARQVISRRGSLGRIVNISTDAARAFPGQVFYGTSKAALEAMTRAAAIELGPAGITVNAVAPGPVQTGYIDDALEQQVLPTIPLRRLGSPDDIVDAVLFLLSDASSWITGQVIQVAGGHAL